MQLNLSGHHLDITSAIRQHTSDKLSKIKHHFDNVMNVNMILAVVVGMFLHISTTIIFETTENHKFNLLKLVSILVGVTLALGIF